MLSILSNEKYKGDAVLQKSFTVDFLTKKKKLNQGEVPSYYVENSHPAIITSEIFDLVQQDLKKRKNVKGYKTGGGPFSAKIECGDCGAFFGSKVWHSTSKYPRVIWQCNHKFKNEKKCETPHINEEKIKEAFLETFNSLIENKDGLLKDYEAIIQTLTDTSKLDKESVKLQSECEVVAELLRRSVDENAHSALDQKEYHKHYIDLVERYETAKHDLDKIEERRLERKVKSDSLAEFIKKLEQREKLLTNFDEELWSSTVDSVTVHSENKVTFTFRDGMELEWKI